MRWKKKLQFQLRLLLGFSYKASTTAHYMPKCTGFTSFVFLCSTQRKEQHACTVHDVPCVSRKLTAHTAICEEDLGFSRESYSLLQFLLSTIYLVEVSMPATMVDITNGKAVNCLRMRLNETRQLWNHIVSSQATLTV